MIEEIVYQQSQSDSIIIAIFLAGFVLVFCGLMFRENQKFSYTITGVGVFIIFVIIPLSDNENSSVSVWKEQVRQQVDSLECEDLQEAYEIYEMGYIKDKFDFECHVGGFEK